MTHAWFHAERSVELFGGSPEDYLDIHEWFDEPKAHMPDLRHRALRHHAEGVFLCEKVFGPVRRNSAGKVIPVRTVAEQHVRDDLGRVPTVTDWLSNLRLEPWMCRSPFTPLTDSLAEPGGD